MPSLAAYEGNPRYAVNLIELDDKHEYLRELVFYNIFQRTVIIENLEAALKYRKLLIAQKIKPPPVYTLSGERITSDGVLNPQRNNKIPNELSVVFGQQPIKTTSEYINLQSGLFLSRWHTFCW